jgi:hypothetical protein
MGLPDGSTQQCFDPRSELGKCKGLGEVIIATGFETAHALIGCRQRTQHQHRGFFAESPQRLKYRQAIDIIGQHAIEHDDVPGLASCSLKGLNATVANGHQPAKFSETVGGVTGVVGVILDDEAARHIQALS